MAVVASALVRKLTRFMPLDRLELEALGRLERGRRTVRADTDLVHERQTEHTAFILEEGWAFAYKMLQDGSRQVDRLRPARRFHGPAQRLAQARIGRILIATGRDAADVPLTHTFGPNILQGFRVWTDEVTN